MDRKLLQTEYAAYKRQNPVQIKEIIAKYEPVFDKYTALYYWKNRIAPPICSACGVRVTVAFKQVSVCKSCTDNAMKYSYEKFVTEFKVRINEIDCSIAKWGGLKSKGEHIEVTCNIHNETSTQLMRSFIDGRNPCKQCIAVSYSTKVKWPKSKWIEDAKKVHNNFYDYSIAGDAKDHSTKIDIICPLHGEFNQTLNVHLNGHGCYQCGIDSNTLNRAYTTESFVTSAKEKHNNKYDYTETVYTGIRNKLKIKCPLHGLFEQVAYYHTAGNGCPTCGKISLNPNSVSGPEIEIYNFVKSLVPDTEQSNRTVLTHQTELDIYCPSKKFAIELNGIYWHSSRSTTTDYKRSKQHLSKTETCVAQGIQLLHIFDSEWKYKKNICKSMICQKLGMSDRVYARKCTIANVSPEEARAFQEATHLQGFTGASVYLGLYYNTELVALASFGKPRYSKTDFELIRFSSKLNTTVIGGFSKIISYFCQQNKNCSIISYANRRWSEGNVYLKNGFKLSHVSEPCYFYTSDHETLLHRSSFMKSKLKSKLENFNPNLTEVENMYANKYSRIWDCGNYVFVLKSA